MLAILKTHLKYIGKMLWFTIYAVNVRMRILYIVKTENISLKKKKLSKHDVIESVCPNPHCDNGIVGEVYGEKMYCNLCYEGQTVL